MEQNNTDDEEFIRFRAKAAELLGVTGGNQSEKQPENEERREAADQEQGSDSQESLQATPVDNGLSHS